NNRHGGFERITKPPFEKPVARDQTGIVGFQVGPQKTLVLAGSSNYEDGGKQGSAVAAYSMTEGDITDLLPGPAMATGPIAAADYDGDGSLDLFVGGRVVSGRYPEPASSYVYRNDHGTLIEDAGATALLKSIGLV